MPHGYGPLVLPRLDDGANRRRSPHRGTVREVEAARRAASAAAHTRTGPGLRWRSPANRRELTSWSKGDRTIRETGLVRKYLERRYERMEPEDKPVAGGEMPDGRRSRLPRSRRRTRRWPDPLRRRGTREPSTGAGGRAVQRRRRHVCRTAERGGGPQSRASASAEGPETPSPFPYLPSTPREVPLAYLEVVGLQPGDYYGAKVTVDDRRIPGEPSVLPASRAMMRSAARAQLAEYVAIHWEERLPCVTTTCWRLYGNTGRPRTPTTSTGSTESIEMTQYSSIPNLASASADDRTFRHRASPSPTPNVSPCGALWVAATCGSANSSSHTTGTRLTSSASWRSRMARSSVKPSISERHSTQGRRAFSGSSEWGLTPDGPTGTG